MTFDTPRGPIFARVWGTPDLPPLLMLHGFPEYSGAFAELAPELAEHYFCIAPDQRGYGRTGGPDDVGAYTTAALVSDMVAVIGAFHAQGHREALTVLGHDWGAAVAYGLAMFHPDLVDRLVIMNGVHPVPFQRALASGGPQCAASQYILRLREDGSEDWLSRDDYAPLMRLFSAHMDMGWLDDATRAAYRTEWARPGRLRTMIHWYRASPLVVAQPGAPVPMPPLPLERLRVPQPHLLLWGMDDTALLPEATEGLEDFAPNLTRVDIAGADHWLAHQKPAEVAGAILNWAKGLDAL